MGRMYTNAMPNEILIIISGANLVALIGLVGKVWSWSSKLESRLAVLENQMNFLCKVEAQRMYGNEFKAPRQEVD